LRISLRSYSRWPSSVSVVRTSRVVTTSLVPSSRLRRKVSSPKCPWPGRLSITMYQSRYASRKIGWKHWYKPLRCIHIPWQISMTFRAFVSSSVIDSQALKPRHSSSQLWLNSTSNLQNTAGRFNLKRTSHDQHISSLRGADEATARKFTQANQADSRSSLHIDHQRPAQSVWWTS
jgi:hypothetical protein